MSSNFFTMNTLNYGENPFDSNKKNFNVNSSHPLIQSSQEYMFYKKFISIHSEDRDMLKFPNSSDFEIELPEDLLNVASLRLADWTFPANYDTFSSVNSNIEMKFKINNPYNPNNYNEYDLLSQKIFEYFLLNNKEYTIVIEEGFYNPQQMVTELTNKFNDVITANIRNYFINQSTRNDLNTLPMLMKTPITSNDYLQQEYITVLNEFNQNGGYTNFIVVYNNVSQKIWFGNTCDGFSFDNKPNIQMSSPPENYCGVKAHLQDFSNWGLAGNIGLPRSLISSVSGSILKDNIDNKSNKFITTYNNDDIVPRFFYGDVTPGDNGFWLLPNKNLKGSEVHWLECSNKINFMGPAYMYMELDGNNCIDETTPYNPSLYTFTTNQTNGIVNSAFAKIAIPTTPLSQWFDKDSSPYKYYYPPAERMRKFHFKIRYHNGLLVNFGSFNYSFVLEFTLQMPQLLRNSKNSIYPPKIGNC